MKKKSFTFVELIVVSVLMAVMIGMLLAFLMQTRSILQTTDITTTLYEDARRAISNMTQELRRTTLSQITITQDSPQVGTDSLSYKLPADDDSDGEPDLTGSSIDWGTTITISLDLGTGNLVRTQGVDAYVLAKNVESINFSLSSVYSNELEIGLVLEKTSYRGRDYNVTSTSIINMRN